MAGHSNSDDSPSGNWRRVHSHQAEEAPSGNWRRVHAHEAPQHSTPKEGIFSQARKFHEGMGGGGGLRDWARATAGRYREIHSNVERGADAVKSDVGMSTARLAAGETVNTYLKRKLEHARKKGGLMSNLFYNAANIAFSETMRRLKDDQRTFVNVARVRRGDPDIKQMTHNELRHVLAHAEKYGGKDAHAIHASANAELLRRGEQKASEHAAYDQQRRDKAGAAQEAHKESQRKQAADRKQAARQQAVRENAENLLRKMETRDQLHQQKVRHLIQLRSVAGHGTAAEQATTARVKAAAGGGKSARDPKVKIVGRTKSGKDIAQYSTGTKKTVSKEVAAQIRGGRAKPKGTTPSRTSRRRSV